MTSAQARNPVHEWLRRHSTGTALSVTAALIGVKTILPGIFDFVIDLAVLGIVWVVAQLHR